MIFRKWFSLLLVLALCLPLIQHPVQAQSTGISIYLDGQEVKSDIAPYILPQVNVTMVPLRVISEGLGATVSWHQDIQTATISTAQTTLTMTVDDQYAMVNDNYVKLDAAVQNRQGRVMVPLRFVAEQLGLQVNWDQATQTISLDSGQGQAPVVETPPVAIDTPEPEIPQPPAPQIPPAANDDQLKGVWVSTVFNLDWPSTSSYSNAAKQQQEYIKLLDDMQNTGINTVFVQVRPAADALYPSSLVPWSKFLTGTQGINPGYDPLAFMVEETHRRGMEFHAWFNPFRANTDANTTKLAANHVAKLHPEWIVNAKNKLYINPGIPQARQRIIQEIMEVVNRYNIDGVHLDDYFYPSDGVFPDDATFKAYNSKKFATKAEWRRDNINAFIQQLGQAIHAAKPQVKFGVSPFGVWRNSSVDPTGSATNAGVTAYDHMHADVRTWIQQEWIDYVIPQIYWSLSFSKAQYGTLVDWWTNEVSGTDVHLYIGHAPYKLGTNETGWQNAQEIIHQLEYNRQYPQVKGDVFFSAKDLRKNPLGILDALRAYYTK
ncbi:family 10 glycosylhydrolase [Brevibacillus migulae]|uniref:family 10 glycosylhydrolase n=1 Tax=Brevibacillus migulae TaxID=1644114 RepID=UPI00106E83D6|nr:family 10 glycosylhydrolase [Brevibacillus migulae]